jgi:hypothetical protein
MGLGDPSYVIALLFEGGFYILLLIFTLQALFLGFHWFSYGSSRKISLIALAVYLLGGAILFITLSLAMRSI